jgi:hypothetical protein
MVKPNMFSWKSNNASSRYSVELTRDAAFILQQAGVFKVCEITLREKSNRALTMF